MTFSKPTQGFTLIELIISLSIIAILTAYAIPSYQQFKQNQTMTHEINRLVATINYARTQSITISKHVILCPSVSFNACDGDSQWHNGWMVFVDSNRDRAFNDGDRMLLNENRMNKTLTAIASSFRPKIRFDAIGFAPGTNLTIRFCDTRGSDHGKAIIISNVGRPRLSQNIISCY